MRQLLTASLMIGVLCAAAWAQEQGANERRGGPPGQRGVRDGRGGGRGGRGMGDRQGGMGMNRMYDRIIQQLDLDEEQQAKFEEFTADQRKSMEDMRARWEEMQAARESGDEERMAELREQMQQNGGMRGRGMQDGMNEALEKLEPLLREDQVSKLWELQEQMQQRTGGRENYRRVINELPDELELTDEQRDEFDHLVSAQREKMRDSFAELRPLMDEMRKATEAGDDERAAELRQQMADARPSQENMINAVLDELTESLTEEQVEKLAEFRKGLETGGRDAKNSKLDVRRVISAVKRLKLDTDQKADIREIERDAIKEYRQISRDNKEEHAALAEAVKAEIIKVLDEEQVTQFEDALKRAGGQRGNRDASQRDRGNRRDRGDRGNRGERQKPNERP